DRTRLLQARQRRRARGAVAPAAERRENGGRPLLSAPAVHVDTRLRIGERLCKVPARLIEVLRGWLVRVPDRNVQAVQAAVFDGFERLHAILRRLPLMLLAEVQEVSNPKCRQ